MIPAKTLPRTKPKMRPLSVMLIALALTRLGARSADHGIQICGVTYDALSALRLEHTVTGLSGRADSL
jgi:hypothetical protein